MVSVCFYTEGWIIWPMLAAVIIKESLMIIGGLIMLRSNVVAYSDRFGKASTVLFCASITMALLEKSPLPLLLRRICGLSTALFCMSYEDGLALVQTLENVQVLWILPDGTQYQTGNLPLWAA